MKKKISIDNWFFLLILLAYLAYAAIYIEKTSFHVGKERYYALFDDAMISMRYAKNLASGYGLVWNPHGERVEGFSNPLWVLFMSIFHLLPISTSKISLVVQVSGALFLTVNLFFIRLIALEITNDKWIALLSVFLTAFYYSLNNWGLQGMEVSLLTLLISVAMWITIKNLNHNKFSIIPYLLLGVATWLRMDAGVVYAALFLFLLSFNAQYRKQHGIWGLSIMVIFVVSQTLLRYWYFGDLLPNTYYLKMTGIPLWFRIGHGIYVFWQSIWNSNWVFFVIALSTFFLHRNRLMLLLLMAFAFQCLYSIYVGGDAWEHKGGTNRFISTVMPLFFILFCIGLNQLRQLLMNNTQGGRIEFISKVGMTVFVMISLFNFNTLLEKDGAKKWLLIKQPIFAAGSESQTKIGLTIKKFTKPQAVIAVITAGNIPYFSERNAVDLLGKSDKVIARSKMHTSLTLDELTYGFRPGHTKWDYAYSINQLKPDIIAQTLVEFNDEEAAPYLQGQYRLIKVNDNPYYLLNNSPHILWDKVEEIRDKEDTNTPPMLIEELE